jgi:hypothetical protein
MDTLAFKLEADKALKSVLPDQKERALFLSNLKQGRGLFLSRLFYSDFLANPALEKLILCHQIL